MKPYWVHQYALRGDLGLGLNSWQSIDIAVQECEDGTWRLVVTELSDGEAIDGHTAEGFTTPDEAKDAADAWLEAWKQAKAGG